MPIADLCIKRPVFATMLTIALVVMGLFSLKQLGIDLFPRIDFPTVTIQTQFPGASPEEVETNVTKTIEEAVNTIGGIDEINSISIEGNSTVIVQFVLEKKTDVAAAEVKEKVDSILSKLPSGSKSPVIAKFDPDAIPVMTIAISAKREAKELTYLVKKQIKERLETVNNVGSVIMLGSREREIRIVIDGVKLAAYHLSPIQLRQGIAAQNLELPAGRVDQKSWEFTLRTMGKITKVQDFENIIVATTGKAPIRVRDIGHVEDTVEEPRDFARLNGKPAIALQIRKVSGTNTVAVVAAVKDALTQLQKTLPQDIEIATIQDQSRFIKASMHEVQKHLILGAILTSIVVFLFLGSFRSTIIASTAIPASIIATFTLIDKMGFTLNNMTMLGLIVAVGIVIDDAIVVLENIFRHIEEEETPPIKAASIATKEIGLAVMATTFSLLAIFIPIGFMKGIVGRFFQSFGLTAAVAISISLFISFTLTPMLCSRFLRPAAEKHRSRKSILWNWIDTIYGITLRWALKHRWVVTIIAIAVFATSFWLFKVIGKDFVPLDDQSEFNIVVEAPSGTTIQKMESLTAELENKLRSLRGVEDLFTTVGGTTVSVNSATIYVRLIDLTKRKYSQFDVINDARNLLKEYPSLRTSVQAVNFFSSSGGGFRQSIFSFILRGPNLDKLEAYSQMIIEKLRQVPGMVDVEKAVSDRKPEMQIHINRDKAADLGVQVADIATAMNILVSGQEDITKFDDRRSDELYNVRMRVRPEDRDTSQSLQNLYIPSSKAGLVPLGNIVNITEGRGSAVIDHLNRDRSITIVANPNIPMGEAIGEVQKAVKEIGLPPGYSIVFAGRAKRFSEAMINFSIALVLAIIFMYMILAAQFESFLHPITIMLSLPLSLPFALFSLLITGGKINLYSILGLFLLFGIVKKNSILQIDYTNTLRSQGMPRKEAILKANHVRLRPILMTTLTLVAGMLPTAMGHGPGAASRAAVATVVIGGQSLALFLTLLFTPVAYSFFDDIGQWTPIQRIKAIFRSMKSHGTTTKSSTHSTPE